MERIEHIRLENGKISDGILKKLCLSLQLLAAPAQAQLAHFPADRVVLTDELALDFDHWFRCLPTYWKFSEEQIAALTRLNDFLEELSGPLNSDFWTNEALVTNPRWEKVRSLAKIALTACDWPIQIPPPAREENGMLVDNGSYYIQSTE